MARNVYGLDLGTYEIKIYDKKTDEIRREKDVIAMKDKRYIFSAGDEAYEMYEKAPDNIQVVFPMKKGVIAHFDDMQYLLESLLKKEHQFARSEYLVAVPTDVTEVEKRAYYDLVFNSSAKEKSVNTVADGNWGLSFQQEGEAPVANATAEYLAEYNAFYAEKTDKKVLYLTFDAGYELSLIHI